MGKEEGRRCYFLRLGEGKWEWKWGNLWLMLSQAQREDAAPVYGIDWKKSRSYTELHSLMRVNVEGSATF